MLNGKVIEWAMKYAPLDAQITLFLKEYGFQPFNPYACSDELTSKFLDKLFNAFDPTLELKPTSPNENASAPASETLQINNSAQMKSNMALIFSIITLLISLVTFLTSRM
ncbi:MAG: hypothetical protein B7X95_07015 [Methylophilaceae bacterium 17-44-8]|nr:MAG: hypothetical protein B7Y48_09010 [Methylophilales bacterium 28-44-11]OZA05284.1 MAG: hypothetical protein B7X95_07015 [Methylophilaceae bacterium 17-44-8]